MNGETIEGFSPDVYEYNYTVPQGSDIPVVLAETTDVEALPIVVPTFEIPGITSVDVFAQDRFTKLTYNVNFILGTGIDEAQSKLNIFPNPASDKVYIQGVDAATVEIFNVIGQNVYSNSSSGLSEINTSHLENGLYMMQITLENGNKVTHKLYIDR